MIGFQPPLSNPEVPSSVAGDVNSYTISVFAANVKKSEAMQFAETIRRVAPTIFKNLQLVEISVSHVKAVVSDVAE